MRKRSREQHNDESTSTSAAQRRRVASEEAMEATSAQTLVSGATGHDFSGTLRLDEQGVVLRLPEGLSRENREWINTFIDRCKQTPARAQTGLGAGATVGDRARVAIQQRFTGVTVEIIPRASAPHRAPVNATLDAKRYPPAHRVVPVMQQHPSATFGPPVSSTAHSGSATVPRELFDLTEELKNTYRNQAKVSRLFDGDIGSKFEAIYIDLQIVEENDLLAEKVLNRKNEQSVTLEDLLQLGRTLVVGCPGFGKSTLLKLIIYAWSKITEKSTAHQNIINHESKRADKGATNSAATKTKRSSDTDLNLNEELFQRYHLIFRVPLLELLDYSSSGYKLYQVVNRVCFGSSSDEMPLKGQNHLYNILKNYKVLWLLDGFDEIPEVYKTYRQPQHNKETLGVLKFLFKQPNFILTSRPYAVNSSNPLLPPLLTRRVEIVGFTDENVRSYIQKFFGSAANRKHVQQNAILAKALNKYLTCYRNRQFWELAHTPILLEILCWVWKSKQHELQKKTLTLRSLYIETRDWLMLRDLRKPGRAPLDEFETLETRYALPLQALRWLAWNGLQQDKVYLPMVQVKEVLTKVIIASEPRSLVTSQALEQLSTEIRALGVWRVTRHMSSRQYYFIHSVFQQFFASEYIGDCIDSVRESSPVKDLVKLPLNQLSLQGQINVMNLISSPLEEEQKETQLRDMLFGWSRRKETELEQLRDNSRRLLAHTLWIRDPDVQPVYYQMYMNCCNENPLLWAAAYGKWQWYKGLAYPYPSERDSVGDLKGRTPLLWAAREGQLEMIQWLRQEKRAQLNERDYEGRTALLHASRQGHLNCVRWLLEQSASIAEVDNYSYTALTLATRHGHGGMIDLLIEKKASVTKLDRWGGTPLLHAAERGHLGLVTHCLDHEGKYVAVAYKEQRDKLGRTALLRAAEMGHLAVIKWLLTQGHATVEEHDKYQRTALLRAAERGFLETVQWLLRPKSEAGGGSSIEERDQRGHTALINAAVGGHIPLLRWLLQEGKASIAERDTSGRTALFWAAGMGRLPAVKWLLESGGAAVNERDFDGCTPLLAAAPMGRFSTVKWLLEEGGSLIDEHDCLGRTALWWANWEKRLEIAKYLKGKKLEPTITQTDTHGPVSSQQIEESLREYGITVTGKSIKAYKELYEHFKLGFPKNLDLIKQLESFLKSHIIECENLNFILLLIAAKTNSSKLLDWLLKSEDRIVRPLLRKKDPESCTALMLAAEQGNLEVLERLLEYANYDKDLINDRDDEGRTALLLAAERGNLEVVEYLLGVDEKQITHRDNHGNTILLLAAKESRLAVFQWLLDQYGTAIITEQNAYGEGIVELIDRFNWNEMKHHLKNFCDECEDSRSSSKNSNRNHFFSKRNPAVLRDIPESSHTESVDTKYNPNSTHGCNMC